MTILSFKDYPYWAAETLEDIKKQLRQICNVRKDDIDQIGNIPSLFVGGRLVGKIPTNSADVDAGDRPNDVSRDDTNTYILQLDSMGDPQWIKYTGSTF